MQDNLKPIITTTKGYISVNILNVFKCNFNDTYYLESLKIDINTLDKDNLTWFDPFNGRSKINDTMVAIKYCSDTEFIILEKKNNIIKESKTEKHMDYIICEEYNDSMLLASHIRLNITK